MRQTSRLFQTASRCGITMAAVLSAMNLNFSNASAQDLGTRDTVHCRLWHRPVDAPDSFAVYVSLRSDDTLTAVGLAICYDAEDVMLSSISPGPLVAGLASSLFVATMRPDGHGFTVDWVGLADRLVPRTEGVIANAYFKVTGLDFCRSGMVLDTCTFFPTSTCLLTPLNRKAYVPECDFPEYIMCMDAGDESSDFAVPSDFTVAQPHPNPFNSAMALEISVARNSRLTITVVDILGRSVRKLAKQEFEAGSHILNWDGRNEAGAEAASGVYFLWVAGSGQAIVRKLVLLR